MSGDEKTRASRRLAPCYLVRPGIALNPKYPRQLAPEAELLSLSQNTQTKNGSA